MASLVILVVVAVILVGAGITFWVGKRTDRRMRTDMLLKARLVADARSLQSITTLPFTTNDSALPAFRDSRRQMVTFARTLQEGWAPARKYISLYSMREREGVLYFGPESIPPAHSSASPPGTAYEQPPDAIYRVLATGQPTVEGPYTDEYGTFVSAFVPVRDGAEGAVVVVLGMDIMGDDWFWSVARDVAVPVGIMLGLLLALGCVVVVVRHRIQLRESAAHLRAVLDSTVDGIVVVGPTGNVLSANRRFEALWQVPANLTGARDEATLLAFVAEQVSDAAGFRREVERLNESEEERVDTIRCRDGRVFERFTRPVPLGKGQRARLWSFRDITAQRRSAEALRLRGQALEAAANGIFITDHTGRIEWCNPAFTRLTGYRREEVVGKNPRLLKSGEYPPDFYARLWQTVLAGQVWRGEIINRRKDGTFYPEEVTITPVKNDEGRITHFVAIQMDILERRLLENQLRQAQKMEAIGLLAGGVAHDFNNILSAITMQLELMGTEAGVTESLHKGLQAVMGYANRAANLTRQLLMFSRRQILDVQAVDLSVVVAGMVQMLRRVLGEHIRLEHNRGAAAWVEGDVGMLEQVVMNMCVNARDAMPAGGRLTVRTEPVVLPEDVVRSNAEARGGTFICLSISDTGCGMSRETLMHIFEPFYTTKDQGKGTGLGLATAHGIIKQHRGWTEVESVVGQGSTFRVYLPAVNAPVQPESESPAQDVLQGGKEAILLVEDEEALRKLSALWLRHMGYRVLEAGHGAEALAIWEHEKVDLLLTDMVMPHGMTGLDVAQRLRARKPNLPIILATGYSLELSEKGRPTLPGLVFLVKPFDSAMLSATVRRCIDNAVRLAGRSGDELVAKN